MIRSTEVFYGVLIETLNNRLVELLRSGYQLVRGWKDSVEVFNERKKEIAVICVDNECIGNGKRVFSLIEKRYTDSTGEYSVNEIIKYYSFRGVASTSLDELNKIIEIIDAREELDYCDDVFKFKYYYSDDAIKIAQILIKKINSMKGCKTIKPSDIKWVLRTRDSLGVRHDMQTRNRKIITVFLK